MPKYLKIGLIVTGAILAVIFCSCAGWAVWRYKTAEYKIRVDFSIPSSQNRFFVYDGSGKLVFKCRCAHGAGGGSTREKPVFSNRPHSECSSLGRYIVMHPGERKFMNPQGLELYGISLSNYNAHRRCVIIHGGLRNYRGLIPLDRRISMGCFCIPTIYAKRLKAIAEKHTLSLYAICDKTD